MAVTWSSEKPLKGRLGFLDQSGHGKPQGPWVPRQNQCTLPGQGGTEGKTVIDVPFANSQGTGRGNAPDARKRQGSLGL